MGQPGESVAPFRRSGVNINMNMNMNLCAFSSERAIRSGVIQLEPPAASRAR